MANCKCGGALGKGKGNSYVKCKSEGCEAIAFKEAFGTTFTVKEMATMISGQAIWKTGLVSKEKKTTYNSWCEIDWDAEKKSVILNFDKEAPAVGTCICGGGIQDKGKLIVCPSCNRKFMEKMNDLPIPLATRIAVMSGGREYVDGFYSKKKEKEYGAFIVMGDEWPALDFDGDDLTDDDIEKDEEDRGLEEIDENADHLLGAPADKEETPTPTPQPEQSGEAEDLFPDDEDDEDIDPDSAILAS